MLMGHGPASSKAAIHGVLVNVIHSLLSVPQVIENGKCVIRVGVAILMCF